MVLPGWVGLLAPVTMPEGLCVGDDGRRQWDAPHNRLRNGLRALLEQALGADRLPNQRLNNSSY